VSLTRRPVTCQCRPDKRARTSIDRPHERIIGFLDYRRSTASWWRKTSISASFDRASTWWTQRSARRRHRSRQRNERATAEQHDGTRQSWSSQHWSNWTLQVKLIAPQLIGSGKVTKSGRASLGISGTTALSFAGQAIGVEVTSVQPGGPAAKASIAAGDLITKIGNAETPEPVDLRPLSPSSAPVAGCR
jgi:membrane-associated protease RseP (regulator of RpoE activity)